MLTSFTMVGQQVLILFILMGIGAISNRTKLIDFKSVKGITNIVLYFVTPSVVLNSFQRSMEPGLIRGLIIVAIISLLVHTVSILLAHLVIHDKDDAKERVFRFAVVFSNCGFMSLPIEQALLGDIGVFYGSVYIAIFNVVVWTYGLYEMSGDKSQISAKGLIFNPGILGTVIGFLLFIFQIKFPSIIATPISYMAALNTPLPMIIIGYYLGNLKLSQLTTDKKQYISIFLRLVVVPLITIFGMELCRIEGDIFEVCTIACCAPTAAITAMFATKFDKDAQLGAQMVSVATLFSLITIPLLVSLAKVLA